MFRFFTNHPQGASWTSKTNSVGVMSVIIAFLYLPLCPFLDSSATVGTAEQQMSDVSGKERRLCVLVSDGLETAKPVKCTWLYSECQWKHSVHFVIKKWPSFVKMIEFKWLRKVSLNFNPSITLGMGFEFTASCMRLLSCGAPNWQRVRNARSVHCTEAVVEALHCALFLLQLWRRLIGSF